jgi:putative drug exporter of the RND superfamily
LSDGDPHYEQGVTVRRPLSVNGAYESLGRFVVRFRWAVVAFWLVVAVATTAALPSLGSQVNDNNSAFLSSTAASTKAANLAAPLLGGGAAGRLGAITIIASRPGTLTSADLAAIQHEAALAAAVPNVTSTTLTGVSADGRAAQIRVRAVLNANNISKDKTVVNALQGTFARAGAPPGLQLHLAGQVATLVANQASSNQAGGRLQSFSLLFVIVLLLIVFRSIPAAIITLLPSGLALLIATRLIGALGSGGLQISAITQVLLIVLLIGVGTDYGLFLVFRVREELRDGREPDEAVAHAVVRVGESITGSAGTVILALLTLLLASFGLYHDLGLPLAMGMAVMLALGLTLLPALLAILGRRAFWPSNVGAGGQREGAWGRIAGRLVQHPGATLAVGVIVFLALAVGALGYKSGGFGGATSAPAGSDAASGNSALAAHFPQTSSNPANLVIGYDRSVWDDPGPLAGAEAALRSSGAFTQLAGPLNPNGVRIGPGRLAALHTRLGAPQRLPVSEPAGLGVPPRTYNAYRSTAQFISDDGRVVQFEASLAAGAQSSTAAMTATPHIRAVLSDAATRWGATTDGVAGEAAAVYDINSSADRDLKVVIPVAIVAIGLLLALVLRSAVAPLYLIVSVALSYLAALGVATLVFIDLGGNAGISFILPFLMFIFLLALGEDYNILVMTRIREEARTLPLRAAVVKAISRTGSTVTAAGLILGGTFAVFALVGGGGSDNSQLQAIGFGLAAGILMDTFLVRTLLVPSIVMLLGRRNWWPSSLGRDDEIGYRAGSPWPPASSSSPETASAPR